MTIGGVPEMITAIQIYIHHLKDVEVEISPELPRELTKLLGAYNVASEWLAKNQV